MSERLSSADAAWLHMDRPTNLMVINSVLLFRRMDEIKRSREGPVSYGLLSLTGLTPEPVERRIVDQFSAKGTAVMTNVPGPQEPVDLAGTPVRTVRLGARLWPHRHEREHLQLPRRGHGRPDGSTPR